MYVLVCLSCVALTGIEGQNYSTTEISFQVARRVVQKEIACLGAEPGTIRVIQESSFFRPTKRKLRKRRRARKIDPSAKNIRRFKRVRAFYRAGRSACAQNSVATTPESSPSPTATPVATPVLQRFFTNTGELTELGRETFEIPNGLAANVNDGQLVWRAYCQGCHEERPRATFSELRLAISLEPMYYTEELLPDSELAQIMAYLSRFRTPDQNQ